MSEFSVNKALAAIAKRRAETPLVPQPSRRSIDPNSPQERINRAARLEKDLIDQLDWLQHQPNSTTKTARLHTMYDRLGELAAEQGDFARAATISHDPKRRVHYQGLITALDIPSDAHCGCEDDLVIDQRSRTEFRSPAVMTVDQVVGPDGQVLNHDQCRKCHWQNLR